MIYLEARIKLSLLLCWVNYANIDNQCKNWKCEMVLHLVFPYYTMIWNWKTSLGCKRITIFLCIVHFIVGFKERNYFLLENVWLCYVTQQQRNRKWNSSSIEKLHIWHILSAIEFEYMYVFFFQSLVDKNVFLVCRSWIYQSNTYWSLIYPSCSTFSHGKTNLLRVIFLY